MRNPDLASDYIRRAAVRLKAVEVLMDAESWADVVRESQEIVELALKGFLRTFGVEAPRIHDVSDVLLAEHHRLPTELSPEDLQAIVAISRDLRRDRELAFYGAEDLTPTDFYGKKDAEKALSGARRVVQTVLQFLPKA